MFYACRWLLPIDRPPIAHGWIETSHGVIRDLGAGPPPAPAVDAGDVAILPGLVNAHTHLELSWLAGRVPPSESMPEWVRHVLARRRGGGGEQAAIVERAAVDAARVMRATGTVLVGDVANDLRTPAILAEAGLGGVVFHELIGFNTIDAVDVVSRAIARLAVCERELRQIVPTPPVRLTLSAHAPYSVAPALFREIAARVTDGPLTVHLAESADEIEFLRNGGGAFRTLLDDLGVWAPAWEPPGTGPLSYLVSTGYARRGLVAVHGGHLSEEELAELRDLGATLVTCPRSNLWVGAGMPRVSHFYNAGVPVAIGTDSAASVDTLNLFDELAELRRIAPDVAAASLLASATLEGARALGFDDRYGTLAPGKAAALVAVNVPAGVTDVEEYLVGGVPPSAIRPLF